jgi:hypothetical protein
MGYNPSFVVLGFRYQSIDVSGGTYSIGDASYNKLPDYPLTEVKNPWYSMYTGDALFSASDADQNIWKAYRIAELAGMRDATDNVYGGFKKHDDNTFFLNSDDDTFDASWNTHGFDKFAPMATGCVDASLNNITWTHMREEIGKSLISTTGLYSGQDGHGSNPAGVFVRDGVLYDKKLITQGHDNDNNSVVNFHPDYCDLKCFEWNSKNA